MTPIRLFEYLINQQDFSAITIKFASEVCYTSALEVKVVHIYIKALAISSAIALFGILQEEGRFTYASRTLDADEAVVPINFIHETTTHWGIYMLHQVSMRAKECVHLVPVIYNIIHMQSYY